MAAESKKVKTTASETTAGMQISGEQIFNQTDDEVNKESVSAQDVEEAFGSASDSASSAKTTTGKVTSQVGDALNQAKEATVQAASQVLEQAQEKAGSTITEGKQNLAQGLTSLADGVRQLGDNLRNQPQQSQIVSTAANYVDPLAQQLENVAHYLDQKDLVGLSRDLQSFARRNPTLFIGGAFALGLIAARFIKSRPQRALALRNPDIENANRRSRRAQTTAPANFNTSNSDVNDTTSEATA